MSKAVKSDGKNQKMFEGFLAEFFTMSNAERNKAMEWFAVRKENGKERMDDIKLPSLVAGMHAFYSTSSECPAILKKYSLIKLQQGQSSWGCNTPSDPNRKFPWD
tara:strand:+ start:2212 stop:2526 length:315 start_codon:yes stop_codon:yes gene_type:complete